MAYSDLSTVNTSDVANASWANQVKDNFTAVKPRVLQLHPQQYDGVYNSTSNLNGPVAFLGSSIAAGYALYSFLVPADFSSLKKAVARVVTYQTGNFAWNVTSNRALPGETLTAHVISGATTITAASSGILQELDISTILPSSGLTANQTISITFVRHGESSLDTIDTLGIFGPVDLEYNV